MPKVSTREKIELLMGKYRSLNIRKLKLQKRLDEIDEEIVNLVFSIVEY